MKQIPRPWDIYRALSFISCHQWEVYSGVLKGGQNPRGFKGKLIELRGDGVTHKERGTDHGGNHTWRAGKSTISMVFPFCCIRFCDGFSTAVFDGGYHAMHMSNMTTFAKTSICAVYLDSTEEDDALLLNIPAAIGDESISW